MNASAMCEYLDGGCSGFPWEVTLAFWAGVFITYRIMKISSANEE